MKFSALLAGTVVAGVVATAAAAQTADSAPDPVTLSHARHLLQTMHIERTMDQILPAVLQSVSQSMMQDKSQASQDLVQKIDAAIADEFHDFTPRFVDSAATVYARIYTDEELTEMDRFYAGPIGQSVLAKAPQAAKQLMPTVMAEMPDLMRRAMDRFCNTSHCTDQQREALQKAVQHH